MTFDPMITAAEYRALSPAEQEAWKDALIESWTVHPDDMHMTARESLMVENYGHVSESQDKYGDMHNHRSGGKHRKQPTFG